MLEFQQMEFSPLRWSGETRRAALEAETRDVASKMINVGGKNDVFVVDTMGWVSTATLTIGAPRPRLVFDCGRCEQKGGPPAAPWPSSRDFSARGRFWSDLRVSPGCVFASSLVASLNGRPTLARLARLLVLFAVLWRCPMHCQTS